MSSVRIVRIVVAMVISWSMAAGVAGARELVPEGLEDAPAGIVDAIVSSTEMAHLLEAHPAARFVVVDRGDDAWRLEVVADGTEVAVATVVPDGDVTVEVLPADDEPVGGRGVGAVARWLPLPEGAFFLWVALIFVVAVAAPRRDPVSIALAGLAVVWGLAWFVFWDATTAAQATLWVAALLASLGLAAALFTGRVPRWRGRHGRWLGWIAVALVTWAVLLAAWGDAVEDSTIWASIGGRFLMDEGRFPYGALGEGATYGPALYLLHAPFTIGWSPASAGDPYVAGRIVAGLALLGLAFAARAVVPRPSWRPAVAVVFGLPWFLSVADVANVSQLVPGAAAVAAFALAGRRSRTGAVAGGAMLGVGAAAMFVPALALPALVAYRRPRTAAVLGGFLAVVGSMGVFVILLGTSPAELWRATVGFQESVYAAEGGLSMWGRLGLEEFRWMGKVLHAIALVVASAAVVRRPTRSTALLAAGASIAGVLLWKGHVGPWGYVSWFAPLLVLGALVAGGEEPQE